MKYLSASGYHQEVSLLLLLWGHKQNGAFYQRTSISQCTECLLVSTLFWLKKPDCSALLQSIQLNATAETSFNCLVIIQM